MWKQLPRKNNISITTHLLCTRGYIFNLLKTPRDFSCRWPYLLEYTAQKINKNKFHQNLRCSVVDVAEGMIDRVEVGTSTKFTKYIYQQKLRSYSLTNKYNIKRSLTK